MISKLTHEDASGSAPFEITECKTIGVFNKLHVSTEARVKVAPPAILVNIVSSNPDTSPLRCNSDAENGFAEGYATLVENAG